MNDVLTIVTVIAEGKEQKSVQQDFFCERKSVKRTEFYAAFAAGQKPQYEFLVNEMDYASMKRIDKNSGRAVYPAYVIYQGEKLNIIRAYGVAGERTSLICG